jgi:aerobic carbon-monoxide dehydrogenase medium subunit
MKMPPFAYGRADTLSDFFDLWKSCGPDARPMAGGQSLLASLAFRLAEPPALLDLGRIADLSGIRETDTHLSIGAMTTHAAIGRHPLVAHHAPVMAETVPLIAHPAIRNKGTLGGSLAYADPAAEWPAVMVALNATLVLRTAKAERRVPAARFFKGTFETALRRQELIVAVEVPKAKPGESATIVEVARRSGDYAMAGLVLWLARGADGLVQATRPVFFALGAAPVVASGAARALVGPRASLPAAQAALDNDLDPQADIHGGPGMKRHLAKVLLGRAFARLAPVSATAAE